MISTYYDQMKDLDPGSTSDPDDDQSRRENYGFAFNLKEAKIYFAYDHKSGDKLRKLRAWERSPDLEDIIKASKGEKAINYVPWSVYEYDKDDSDKIKLHFGEYDLANTGVTYKIKFDSVRSEKELNLKNDPFRFSNESGNTHNPDLTLILIREIINITRKKISSIAKTVRTNSLQNFSIINID